RNHVIARVFRELDLIEQWGSGVRRMFKEADELGLPKPQIIEIGMRVRFIVHLANPFVLAPETEPEQNQVGVQSSTQLPTQSDNPVQRLLLALKSGEKSSGTLRSVLGIKHRPTFRDNYLRPALDAELIEMTIPEKPSSSNQKYRLTDKGRTVLNTGRDK
ncbi:MAG: AAA family ATPase, partial [ANME-2 cluster archaeon]|nr:AAA family ATPase [ANME-2 cluster archaeon]